MRVSEADGEAVENAGDEGLKLRRTEEERCSGWSCLWGVLGPRGVNVGRERRVLVRETPSPVSIANPLALKLGVNDMS